MERFPKYFLESHVFFLFVFARLVFCPVGRLPSWFLPSCPCPSGSVTLSTSVKRFHTTTNASTTVRKNLGANGAHSAVPFPMFANSALHRGLQKIRHGAVYQREGSMKATTELFAGMPSSEDLSSHRMENIELSDAHSEVGLGRHPR